MMRGHDNLSVNDQMEDLRERMRLLQGDRKVRNRRDNQIVYNMSNAAKAGSKKIIHRSCEKSGLHPIAECCKNILQCFAVR